MAPYRMASENIDITSRPGICIRPGNPCGANDRAVAEASDAPRSLQIDAVYRLRGGDNSFTETNTESKPPPRHIAPTKLNESETQRQHAVTAEGILPVEATCGCAIEVYIPVNRGRREKAHR
jgi:hypothetical protein